MRGFANLPGLIKAYQSPYKGFNSRNNERVGYVSGNELSLNPPIRGSIGVRKEERHEKYGSIRYQSPYKGFNSIQSGGNYILPHVSIPL